MIVSVFYKRLFRESLDVNCKTHAYGRGLSLRFGLQGVSDGLLSALPLRRCGGFKMAEALTTQEQLVRVTLRIFLPPSSRPGRVLLGTHVKSHAIFLIGDLSA